MCLILFSFQPSSDWPLILGANRDEFFARPSQFADYWLDAPNLLGGRDKVAGGTWLGITNDGRFAAVTNVRESSVASHFSRSRGEIPRDFLLSKCNPCHYLQRLNKVKNDYAGFNLLLGCLSGPSPCLYYFSNRLGNSSVDPSNTIEPFKKLNPGVYGLSNHLLDTPWPKVHSGKHALCSLRSSGHDAHAEIRAILENDYVAADEDLPSTGIPLERERALSSRFISALADYGTRTSTVLTVSWQGWVYSEQNYRKSKVDQCSSYLPAGSEYDGPLRLFTHDFNREEVILGER